LGAAILDAGNGIEAAASANLYHILTLVCLGMALATAISHYTCSFDPLAGAW